MKLMIDNVGLLKKTEIVLNGLTVLIGENKSGKSTISKALYSIIEGHNNLMKCRNNDYYVLLQRKFNRCIDDINFELDIKERKKYDEILFDFFDRNYNFLDIIEKKELSEDSIIEFKKRIEILIEQIKKLDYNEIMYYDFMFDDTRADNNIINISEQKERFNSETERIIGNLQEIVKFTDSLSNIEDYTFKILSDMVNREFNNQILYNNNDAHAKISFEHENSICELYFGKDSMLLSDSTIKNDRYLYKLNSFYIDDPLILDNDNYKRNESRFMRNYLNKYTFYSIKNKFHKNKLINALNFNKEFSTEESMQLSKKVSSLLNEINNIIPGKLHNKDNGQRYYFDGEYSLNIENISSGMKIFTILKHLIINDHINENSVIILDEPDSRLHPEWQNCLAEIIMIIIEQLKCKFLVTTHSSNFLLALETYALKRKLYNNKEFAKFYLSETTDDKTFKTFKDKTSDLSDLYKSFSDAYAKMLNLRENILENIYENEK